MTVREFIQTILLETPNLEAGIYIQKKIPDGDFKDYDVVTINNYGSNDGLFIEVEDWQSQR